MRKILPIWITGVLLLSGFGAVAINNDIESLDSETIDVEISGNEKLDFTHTVLAEYGTATWCGYCPYAHTALKNIYASGDYPFYYVSLVRDKNIPVCDPRLFNELNLYGYPTVWFDGGYRVNVGGSTSNEAQFRSSISSSGSRDVFDVDIDLYVTWLGGTKMQIDVSVDNNEQNKYDGTIRVYITEIESSIEWRDVWGDLYTFSLLDFAFKEDGTGKDISISAGDTWSDTTTWDGSDHGFSGITEDNIMVIAAVFNDEWHQGYSYPPTGNPFDAYYVDDAKGVTPGSGEAPNTPPPPDGPVEGVINTEYEFSTKTEDPQGDNVSYLFDWDDGTDSGWLGPYPSGTNQSASHSWDEEGEYKIKVKAKDENGAESKWSTPHTINIYAGPALDISTITGGLFRISTKIRNPGLLAATDVSWTITLEGGTILLGKESDGQISSIPADGEEKVNSKFIFGFGSTRIRITAEMPEGPSDSRSIGASVFLFYIKVNPGGII